MQLDTRLLVAQVKVVPGNTADGRMGPGNYRRTLTGLHHQQARYRKQSKILINGSRRRGLIAGRVHSRHRVAVLGGRRVGIDHQCLGDLDNQRWKSFYRNDLGQIRTVNVIGNRLGIGRRIPLEFDAVGHQLKIQVLRHTRCR